MSKILSLWLVAICIVSSNAQYKIIPEPSKIEYKKTGSSITKEIVIDIPSASNESEILSAELKKLGFKVILPAKEITNKKLTIAFVQSNGMQQEEYSIDLHNNKLKLSYSTNEGAFRGIQTILQMLQNKEKAIKDCTIHDAPRFAWRGLMFDVSRHFFSVADVKAYIDQMAKFKFNVFHWHLTDDEGWRIEIKSMPKLTEIGAWRSDGHGKFGYRPAPKKEDPKIYGGFYTQEQIKDIIDYAQKRHITIVPEIDVPGHSMAFLAAYPQYSTKKEEKYVSNGFKFSDWYADGTFKMLVENTLNPSDENVYTALDKIFTEVAALFPGQYIHVGGDECYHGYWEEDLGCKKFMESNGLKNSLELQSYFMKRIEKIVRSKNKKMIGWDEILYGGLADGAAVMSWRGMKGGVEAAKQGHPVVMTPTQFTYIDYTQADHSLELPIYNDLYLKKAYEFDPMPEGVDPNLILGGQANLWTEQIPHLGHAFYMTYPRALATAEVLWSPKANLNWSSFMEKVENQFSHFDKQGIQISKAVYDPQVTVKMENDKLLCSLSCETPGTELYYTIDNTFPTVKSNLYKSTFPIPEGELYLRVATFRKGKQIGRMLNLHRDVLLKRAGKS